MHDRNGKKLKQNDIIAQVISTQMFPKDTKWKVIEFGIELSTLDNICVIKELNKNVIMCANKYELKFFEKV